MIGIGRNQFALRTEALGNPPGELLLDLPVDVRAIAFVGDEEAGRGVGA